ncbi:MAG: inner membrane protein [Zhongshania marina]|jgi:inner membrane protein
MDPLTQGLLGAVAVRNATSKLAKPSSAVLLGFLAGMAADLDVLIRSNTDPLLFLEYHRQFTHSLIFIPLGGLICGFVLYKLFGQRQNLSWRQSVLFCTLGYATHALLDACTTYGTQLFWPFSNERVAWNIMSIIDPLYTLPIAVLLYLSLAKQRRWAAPVALFWVFAYPALGYLQRDRAEAVGHSIAAKRGHNVNELEAKPSFGNILLWKIVYRTDDAYYVDAVRVGYNAKVFLGGSIPTLDLAKLPWLVADSRQAIDLARFRWFSKGYIAQDPNDPNRIIDIRYSLLPNELDALWSIELSPDSPDSAVSYQTHRTDGRTKLSQLWHMLTQ